tara:strand:+ start:1349 stop:1777 length:429 start_codon:yes stop_codon:yes gene_type:complete
MPRGATEEFHFHQSGKMSKGECPTWEEPLHTPTRSEYDDEIVIEAFDISLDHHEAEISEIETPQYGEDLEFKVELWIDLFCNEVDFNKKVYLYENEEFSIPSELIENTTDGVISLEVDFKKLSHKHQTLIEERIWKLYEKAR